MRVGGQGGGRVEPGARSLTLFPVSRLEAILLLTIALHEAIEQFDCLTDFSSNTNCNLSL